MMCGGACCQLENVIYKEKEILPNNAYTLENECYNRIMI